MSKSFWIICGLGLLIRLIIAWLPIEVLIKHTLPDDAFIYFVIARNLGAGLGATFDGLKATNGFHPLWAFLIAPIFRLVSDRDVSIHLVLSVSALCDVAAGALAAKIVSGLTKEEKVAPLLTLGLYVFNPRAIQESANGLETGLAMLVLAACVVAWVQVTTSPQSIRKSVLFGVLSGLTFLARSDLAIILALLFVVLLFKRQWSGTIWAGLVAMVVVAPWFLWSQWQVGTIVQSSGVAIPSLAAYRIQTSTDFGRLWDSLLFPIINYSFRYSLIYPGVAVLAAIIGLLFVRWPSGGQPKQLSLPALLWVPLVGAFAIVLLHTFVRWYPRGWYFVPLAWSVALIAGPLFAQGLAAPIGTRLGRWIVVLLGVIVVAQGGRMLGEPDYQWQADMRTGADWLAQNTEPDTRVGAFNAGIYAYYSGRTVLSLDGLVDWGAIEARQEKRLLDYFVEQGGTLIIDHEAYAIGSFSPFFGARTLIPVETLPVTDDQYGPITIYRVQ